MSKKNPYDNFTGILAWAGIIAFLGLIGFLIVYLFIIFPIIGFLNGEPWYEALAPLLLTGIIVGVVLFFEFVVVRLWKKFISEPWRRKRDAWDRAEWEREDALPLDPEPFVDYEDENIRYETDELGWHRLSPREGYNPHGASYGRTEYGW